MLVVIALIAVLAMIAGWALGGMMDRGADAQDLNNLRQIGMAITAFSTENNGRVPNGSISVSGASPDANGNPRASFMESVDRFFPPDAKFGVG